MCYSLSSTIITNGKTSKQQIKDAFEKGQNRKGNFQFCFTINEQYFQEIAKLRAFRILWQQIMGKSPYIFAEISTSNWQKEDAYNNLIASATALMSSVFGTADSILIPDYNFFKQQTDFSQRLARNQHHILREESYLDKVQDPTAGAYFIEQLTTEILKYFGVKQQETKLKSNGNWLSAEQIEVPNIFNKKVRAATKRISN